ncbi:RlpA-like double-psi beta-barrel-protein domain-containing protein-containing protein [Cytidiella melzeri]|nr:RlpA-like double-psi beta-barrel-protein domain-containing protein-containing protein [Cytidiella melzeri]
MTFYETGLGACGKTNSDSDFIVALNSPQYGSGGHCFDTITISYGGKSTQAQIVDECPGCPEGGLDLSPGLFSFFASEDAGVIYGSWNFGGAAQKPSPTPTPTPTPKPSPTPKTTSTPPPPSTSEKKTTTSSSATPSSSSSSSSASSSSSSSSASSAAVVSSFASSSASATPSPSVNPAAGLDSLNDAFLGMVILAASQ